MVRFGAPIFTGQTNASEIDPDLLVAKHKEKGYTAAYAPLIDPKDSALIKKARLAFENADIVLAEVGYWKNLMDLDDTLRKKHRAEMLDAFYLAEELGARCVVNISGVCCNGNEDFRFTEESFSDDAFDAAVDMARYFIDTVKPKTAYFTYEIFPFNVVDSVESMQKLVKAVDRDMFGIHFDLCNLINSPRSYFGYKSIIEDTVKYLGDKIVAAHVKDIKITAPSMSVILEEVQPGQGIIDFGTFFSAIDKLPQAVPMMVEHLSTEQEYDDAAAHIRSEVKKAGITI